MGVGDAEHDLERRIVLGTDARQRLLEQGFVAVQGFEDGDRRERALTPTLSRRERERKALSLRERVG
jgi:hypothetical protein